MIGDWGFVSTYIFFNLLNCVSKQFLRSLPQILVPYSGRHPDYNSHLRLIIMYPLGLGKDTYNI